MSDLTQLKNERQNSIKDDFKKGLLDDGVIDMDFKKLKDYINDIWLWNNKNIRW